MPSQRPVQLTYNVHPQLAVDARRLVELLLMPDHRGHACRAAVRRRAIRETSFGSTFAGFLPIESYQGNVFRLDLRGPETLHGLERDYDGAYLSSDAYAVHLSAEHAIAMADKLRLSIDLIIGNYVGDHEIFRSQSL